MAGVACWEAATTIEQVMARVRRVRRRRMEGLDCWGLDCRLRRETLLLLKLPIITL